ncbi:hypothetical protein RJ639_031938 [Escallonia herrerae]|uniref:Uncharacterized protein n=1 Tax=Escallonia herrerae TaxID=1293975 RepID=A0AA88X2H8_9ASTE|nr:hypothetical protein RJ639_031938 [Escallonia herrerae]
MALSSMLRKVSPSVVIPLALRAVASPRTLHDSILAAAFGLEESSGSTSKRGGSFLSNRDFSTVTDARKKADGKLLKAVQSELKTAKKYERQNRLPPPPLPAKFPFRIYDLPGESSIKLIREFGDEEIEVKIDTYQLLDIEEDYEYSHDNDTDDSSSNDTDDCGSDSDGDSHDSSDDSQSDKGDQDGSDEKSSDCARIYQKYTPSMRMTVTVCKKSPYNFKRLPEVESLSTGCYWDERNYIQKSIDFTIAASKEEIQVRSMSFNDGPLYERYMDKKLQDHFVKYLEVRGITRNIRTFVVKHVNNKKRHANMLNDSAWKAMVDILIGTALGATVAITEDFSSEICDRAILRPTTSIRRLKSSSPPQQRLVSKGKEKKSTSKGLTRGSNHDNAGDSFDEKSQTSRRLFLKIGLQVGCDYRGGSGRHWAGAENKWAKRCCVMGRWWIYGGDLLKCDHEDIARW